MPVAPVHPVEPGEPVGLREAPDAVMESADAQDGSSSSEVSGVTIVADYGHATAGAQIPERDSCAFAMYMDPAFNVHAAV